MEKSVTKRSSPTPGSCCCNLPSSWSSFCAKLSCRDCQPACTSASDKAGLVRSLVSVVHVRCSCSWDSGRCAAMADTSSRSWWCSLTSLGVSWNHDPLQSVRRLFLAMLLSEVSSQTVSETKYAKAWVSLHLYRTNMLYTCACVLTHVIWKWYDMQVTKQTNKIQLQKSQGGISKVFYIWRDTAQIQEVGCLFFFFFSFFFSSIFFIIKV